MYCRYCGKKTEGNNTVCSTCSKKQDEGEKAKGKVKKIALWVVVVLFLLSAISVIAFFAFRKSHEEKVTGNLHLLLEEEKGQLEPESVGSKIAEFVYGKVSFEVISASRKQATVIVSSPDIYTVYMATLQSKKSVVPESKEEYAELVNSLLETVYNELNNGNYNLKNYEITIELRNEHDIILSYELIDALYGGLLRLQGELINEYTGGSSQ